MEPKAVIFDMDGLLFNTEATGRWAWDKALAQHGYAMTDDIYMQFLGHDMKHREHVLKTSFGHDFPFESVKALRISLGDDREIEQGLEIKPGAANLLAELSRAGMPIGLATGTVRTRTLRRLRSAGLQDYFCVITTGDEVTHGKPSPEVYLQTAQKLGLPPQACLVFEDSCAGVQSAASAGMCVVMVPDLETPTLETERMAHCILPSLVDVTEKLPSLLGKPVIATVTQGS